MELDHPQNTFESIKNLQSKCNLPNFQGGYTNKKNTIASTLKFGKLDLCSDDFSG
jgi:hypothetical protein